MKFLFTLSVCVTLLTSVFLARPAQAVDECSAYSSIQASCVPTASDCDESFEAKEKIKQAQKTVGKGTLDGSGIFISGICASSGSCCIKKPAETAGTGDGNNFSSTTSNGEVCGSVCQWIKATYTKPDNYDGPIPKCAFSGTCRNTNDLVQVLIEQGKMIFGLIGMVALAAFVYGGFLMVFSFGASDRVQQGKDVMVAAVIGIVIVFTAYLLINFILNALGVSPEFQAIK